MQDESLIGLPRIMTQFALGLVGTCRACTRMTSILNAQPMHACTVVPHAFHMRLAPRVYSRCSHAGPQPHSPFMHICMHAPRARSSCVTWRDVACVRSLTHESSLTTTTKAAERMAVDVAVYLYLLPALNTKLAKAEVLCAQHCPHRHRHKVSRHLRTYSCLQEGCVT